MIAGIVIVMALFFLVMQFTNPSVDLTIASEFKIPAGMVFTSWSMLDRPLHALVYDAPIGVLLLLAGAAIFWLSDWFNEKVGWQFEGAPSAPAVSDQETGPTESSA